MQNVLVMEKGETPNLISEALAERQGAGRGPHAISLLNFLMSIHIHIYNIYEKI